MFLVAHILPNKNNKDVLNYIREVEYDALLFFLGVLLLASILKEVGVYFSANWYLG